MNVKLSDAKREEGFTLIELLVVVIIIGILAAIAIPVFLNQRQRAWDRAVESDLRNAATAQEVYYSDYDKYWDASDGDLGDATATGEDGGLLAVGFNNSDAVEFQTIVGDGESFCMSAWHEANENDSLHVWHSSDGVAFKDGDDGFNACDSGTGGG